ncbi:hypothetical protein LOTGIDRAFT_191207, partial [Lottia gigantea]
MQQRRTSLADCIPDWPTLQKAKKKTEEKETFIEDLDDHKTLEGTKMIRMSCVFCKPNAKLKWFKSKMEIFHSHKHHFEVEDNKYTLIINNVKLEDGGKYTCQCNKETTSAWLYVE